MRCFFRDFFSRASRGHPSPGQQRQYPSRISDVADPKGAIVKPANFMLLLGIAVYIAVTPPVIVFMSLLFAVQPYYFLLSLIPLALVVLLWVVSLIAMRC